MPLTEISMVRGSLSEEAIAELVEDITNIVLRHQGADVDSEAARSITCVIVQELDDKRIYQGGVPASDPIYRLLFSVPEGALDDEKRRSLVDQSTKAVMKAEGREWGAGDGHRVWCIINTVPDGNWGSGGVIFRWRDIQKWVVRKNFLAKRQARDAITVASKSQVTTS